MKKRGPLRRRPVVWPWEKLAKPAPRTRLPAQLPVPERAFATAALAKGWTVTKRGWPDFACWGPHGEFCVVEVKHSPKDWLRREQRELCSALAGAGVKVYRWDPHWGFVRWRP